MNRISVRTVRWIGMRAMCVTGIAAVSTNGMIACKQRAFNSRTKDATAVGEPTVLDKNIPADYNVDKLVDVGVQSSEPMPGSDLIPTEPLMEKGIP